MAEEMKQSANHDGGTGWLARMKRPPQCSMRRLLVIGVVFGIIIWGGINTGMEWTNRSDFCISCHEMTIPYEDLKKTVHFKNHSGARAQCADCHIASSKYPADYLFKSLQKLLAARDVMGHISGVVDTPEKFEEHRRVMAERVWERMRSRDSKECRNCHAYENMDLDKQDDLASKKHSRVIAGELTGKTCIDCHRGIAHRLPKVAKVVAE